MHLLQFVFLLLNFSQESPFLKSLCKLPPRPFLREPGQIAQHKAEPLNGQDLPILLPLLSCLCIVSEGLECLPNSQFPPRVVVGPDFSETRFEFEEHKLVLGHDVERFDVEEGIPFIRRNGVTCSLPPRRCFFRAGPSDSAQSPQCSAW